MAGEETIYGHVLLTGYVEKEGDQFASYCRELGSASCGDTMEEALENLGEAIEVHLEALEETGELLRALRERNIRIDAGPPDFDGIYIKSDARQGLYYLFAFHSADECSHHIGQDSGQRRALTT